MKLDKTYKMSKSIKSLISLSKFKDSHERGKFKRSMIEATISGSTLVDRKKVNTTGVDS